MVSLLVSKLRFFRIQGYLLLVLARFRVTADLHQFYFPPLPISKDFAVEAVANLGSIGCFHRLR